MIRKALLTLLIFVLMSCSSSQLSKSLSKTATNQTQYEQWSLQDWLNPPKTYYPMVRWWWPGGNIDHDGITAELTLLNQMGFSGVEIQPFAFGINDNESDIDKVRSVGNSLFSSNLNYALEQAQKIGMKADLTMSSGWGLGGKIDCAHCGSHQLLMASMIIEGPTAITTSLPIPVTTPFARHPAANALGFVGDFDPNVELIRAMLGKVENRNTDPIVVDSLIDITDQVSHGQLNITLPAGQFRVFAIYRNLTNVRLAGAAYLGDPADFRTIDHLNSQGLDAFKSSYFTSISTLTQTPRSYFIDSFELVADLPWTPKFAKEFQTARGYDISAYLPLLFLQEGDFSFVENSAPRVVFSDLTQRVREDYIDVRAQLFQSQFIEPVKKLIHSKGAKLRLQALGGYGDYLDVFSAADIPEAEDFGLDGVTEFQRLASSAAHISGRQIVSNEAFVSNATSPTALTQEQYFRKAGNAFSAGINQLVMHGRAYPMTLDNNSRWYPFQSFNITTQLDDSNSIWPSLPKLNRSLARLSYAMTRGKSSTQVAWLTTELRSKEFDLVSPSTAPGLTTDKGPYLELNQISRALRKNAIGYDRVSRLAISSQAQVCGQKVCIGETDYDLILVDYANAVTKEWLMQLHTFAQRGIPIVFVGDEPTRVRGLPINDNADEDIRALMSRLRNLPSYHFLESPAQLGPLLAEQTKQRLIQPIAPEAWPFSTNIRETSNAYLIYVYNGQRQQESTSFKIVQPDQLTPLGKILILDPGSESLGQEIFRDGLGNLQLSIPAGRSRVIQIEKL